MFREKVVFIVFPGVHSGSYEGFLYIGDKREAHVRRRLLDSDEESQWNPGMTVQDSYAVRTANARPGTLALREWTILKTVNEVTDILTEKLNEYVQSNPQARIKKSPVVKVVSAVEAMVYRNRMSKYSAASLTRNNFFI